MKLMQKLLYEKEHFYLVEAIKSGYYDCPKRITQNNLSKLLGIAPSTLCAALHRIESKVFYFLMQRNDVFQKCQCCSDITSDTEDKICFNCLFPKVTQMDSQSLKTTEDDNENSNI